MPRRHQVELGGFQLVSSANLVEGLEVGRIRCPQVLGREAKNCGVDVMVVDLEVHGKLARALVVVLEEGHKPRHVQWSGRP